jgi:hypothetical protein
MFINTTDPSWPCISCTLSNCTTCFSLTQCSSCDTSNGYFLNVSDGLCYGCWIIIPNCITCISYDVCSVCNYTDNYYFINGTCVQCSGVNMFVNFTDPNYKC